MAQSPAFYCQDIFNSFTGCDALEAEAERGMPREEEAHLEEEAKATFWLALFKWHRGIKLFAAEARI